jgi:hypothetical protein
MYRSPIRSVAGGSAAPPEARFAGPVYGLSPTFRDYLFGRAKVSTSTRWSVSGTNSRRPTGAAEESASLVTSTLRSIFRTFERSDAFHRNDAPSLTNSGCPHTEGIPSRKGPVMKRSTVLLLAFVALAVYLVFNHTSSAQAQQAQSTNVRITFVQDPYKPGVAHQVPGRIFGFSCATALSGHVNCFVASTD